MWNAGPILNLDFTTAIREKKMIEGLSNALQYGRGKKLERGDTCSQQESWQTIFKQIIDEHESLYGGGVEELPSDAAGTEAGSVG